MPYPRRVPVDPTIFVAAIYWLALAAWFGAALFVAAAAPAVHRAVRDADPTLPTVLSVNLEGQHAALLGGRIVGDLLNVLGRVEVACGAALGLAQAAEWALFLRDDGRDPILPLIRTTLLLAAAAMAVYAARSVRPRAEAAREQYVENADEPDLANPALDRFEAAGRDSATALWVELAALGGLIFFTAIGLGVRGAITLTAT